MYIDSMNFLPLQNEGNVNYDVIILLIFNLNTKFGIGFRGRLQFPWVGFYRAKRMLSFIC
jgi:hypothetical protein